MDQVVTDHIKGRTGTDILVIEAPPRHGKSELISKWVSPWFLSRWPDQRVILAAYEHGFARTWGRKGRDILTEHGGLFGVHVRDDSAAASDWLTNYEGGMLTAGAGGPMTGRGANLLIIDDPFKNAESAVSETIRDKIWDWWQSTASTRIEPGGKAIIIATRWHEDDLSGRIIRQAEERGGKPVKVLTLRAVAEDDDILGRPIGAALWPERYDEAALEQIRIGRDTYWWLSLFQQRAGRPGESEWPEEYFADHIWADRWPDAFEVVGMGVDPSKGKNAKRGDYSAIVTIGISGGLAWVDASLERRPTDKIIADTLGIAAESRADVVNFETNGFQEDVAERFRSDAWNAGLINLATIFTDNVGNKELRLQWKLGPKLKNKLIRFRNSPGCRLLVQQLREFPLGRHDDGPDALEMAFSGLDRYCHGDGHEVEIGRALI